MRKHIEQMFQATAWANRTIIEALQHCPAAQDEALPILAHLLAAEAIWLGRLEGRPVVQAVHPQLTLDECQSLADANVAGYQAFLTAPRRVNLDTAVSYCNSRGEPFATSVIDILLHVFAHGAYHRGQIAKAFGHAGQPAVNTDYITFVRSLDH